VDLKKDKLLKHKSACVLCVSLGTSYFFTTTGLA